MSAPGAFGDPAALAERLARWRILWGGRPLFRVAAGRRWARLHLAGDERFCLLLTAVPGATMLVGLHGRLPEPLAAALPSDRDHPLPTLLAGARLTALAALPGERVACLRLERPDGSPLHLLHQLFGSPGNTVLLDGGGHCLWAARRPPHALLSVVPGRQVYAESGRGDPNDPAGTGVPEAEDDDSAALDHLASVLAGELRARVGAAIGRRLRAAEKLCAHRQRDLDAAGTGDEHRRRAEALAAHLHAVRPGASRCEVADLRDGTPLVIDLDPARSPSANLDALFHRARKAERGREVIAANLAEARTAAEALGTARSELEALPLAARGAGPDSGGSDVGPGDVRSGLAALAGLQNWLESRAGLTGDDSGLTAADLAGAARGAALEEPIRPFRRYVIDGRWEVWVGRSSRENDELTHRAAHGRDLWLHAHGATGSHVIVRTGGRPDLVPREVVEKAASLAALHSKARHASLVPVVWTEKRYVRKPRKAPPGLAVCLQDRTLMVAPGIASGVEPA